MCHRQQHFAETYVFVIYANSNLEFLLRGLAQKRNDSNAPFSHEVVVDMNQRELESGDLISMKAIKFSGFPLTRE